MIFKDPEISEEKLMHTLDLFGFAEHQKESLLVCLCMVKEVDIPTYEHSLRSGFTNLRVAEFIHLNQLISFGAGLLHDVGKVLTNPNALRKKCGFNMADKEELSRHPLDSYNIIRNMSGMPKICAEIAVRHHLFGKNPYPHELPDSMNEYSLGEQVLINYSARILSLSESYVACLYRENDRNSPGNPRLLTPEEVKVIMFEENSDQNYLLNRLYRAGIFK
jgi:response regulator RpfG family c-di-GMP phosphodiesterase